MTNEKMLEIKNVQKNFGGIKALQGVSFTVPKEQITALIGPNGAGKTTLLDILSGLIEADRGKIVIADQDLIKMHPHEIANLGVSRTFQQARLFENLSIQDHLTMIENSDDTRLFRNLFQTQKVKNYNHDLREFGIEKDPDTLVSDLSYGQRKLLQLLMAVKKSHKILLLDEPVAGVNSVIQERIEGLLLELKKQGETIMIIDHDIEFVKKLADKVVVLDEGKVLLEGRPDKVLKDKRVLRAYLGE